MRTTYLFLLLYSFFLFSSCGESHSPLKQASEAAEKKLSLLLHHYPEWVKVHAAEFILDLKLDLPVDSILKKENEINGKKLPYRIGIWRVLSQTDEHPQKWINKITSVALDTTASDQIHAIETLAKLQVNPDWISTSLKNDILNGNDVRLKSITQWALAIPSAKNKKPQIDSLLNMLFSNDITKKQVAALGLKKLNHFPKDQWKKLAELALDEDENSTAKIFLLSAALAFAPDQNNSFFKKLKESLLALRSSFNKTQRYVLCETLAEIGKEEDLPILMDLVFMTNPIISIETLESPQEHPWNIDVSGAAAYGVIKIVRSLEKRKKEN